ncbi:MAG: nucleotidyl transferase AbiEii/AbiGii toxin family protein [Patescibacteria group bacterium]|nr:nucleotidyl transferase AbiEii/AbiGii toxin family protein [Patescibacteria group bacterium]
MGKKMAAGEGLTPQQKQLLDLIVNEPYFLDTFYLSGGTALASWYLHHRESYDLDFFSLIPFDYERIIRWFRHNQERVGCKSFRFEEDFGFLMVYLRYDHDLFLKVDFHHYSKTKLASGIRWKNLEIDSIRDITVNKLQTISTLPRTRDYVDLYYILRKNSRSLDAILRDHAKKFPCEIDPLHLAKNFLKVSEYTDFPIMLVDFDYNAMFDFYERLAQSLKRRIFKS